MNKLIIDAASEKIFLMIISNASIYNITQENTKINYEKLTIIINDFLSSKNIDYYCYNLDDFKDEKDLRYENIPNLCKKYKIKKNLINPVYLS